MSIVEAKIKSHLKAWIYISISSAFPSVGKATEKGLLLYRSHSTVEVLLSDIYRLIHSISISSQDGHEICFVGDEAFRELSQTDPEGDKLLDKVRT